MMNEPNPPESAHPLATLTDAGLDMLLRRAIRITLVLGVLAALVVWKASGWRNAAMLGAGAAISAASILEWQRFVRFINAKMDEKQVPRGAAVAAVFFVVRLIVFAGVIYGSLNWFRGSVVALLCGLGMAALAMLWEAVSLLRS